MKTNQKSQKLDALYVVEGEGDNAWLCSQSSMLIEPQAARRQMADAPDFVVASGIYFSLEHPHIGSMANWQRSSFTREPPKTKAELRQMLAEAVRNTQSSADHGPKRPPKAAKIVAGTAYVD